MANMLRIDASARIAGSHSRQVAEGIAAAWKEAFPTGDLTHRDIGDGSIPHISNDTIEAFFLEPDQQSDAQREAIRLSDELVDELQSADTLLLSLPFYNFSMPSVLKAWIDQVVRVNRTFSIGKDGFSGLAKTRRAIVVIAYGAAGYVGDGPMAAADFAEPHLKFLLNFIGIQDITFIQVDGTNDPDEIVAERKRRAVDQGRRAFDLPEPVV